MRTLSAILLVTVTAACDPVELPGELIGTYDIVGQLLENTCGSGGFPAQNPLEFQVQVRLEGDELARWILNEPPGTYGSLDEAGHFIFERQTSHSAIAAHEVRASANEPSDFWSGAAAQAASSHPGCTLLITERVRGELTFTTDDFEGDAGLSGSTGLVGINEIELTPAAGSDCRSALIGNGGPFPTFPCHVQYDLEGQLLAL